MTAPPGGELSGKRAVVTGASRGLGSRIVATFAARGARVAFTYTRDEEGARRTTQAASASGREVLAHRLSVLDAAGAERLARELEERWGGIDVLVNNAGVTQNMPLALIEEEDWDHVFDVNVKGVFLTTRAFLKGMIRRRSGVVINIGSLAGERMLEAPVHYCASKAAIRGLTMAMAKEVARYNVRVHNVAPGLLEDGVGRNLPDYRLADYIAHCALGRVGRFEEVARLAVFLASDASSYMSGETIVVDGGL